MFSFFLFVILYTLGILVTDLTTLFSFIGAICANSIAYILPAAFFMKLTKNKNLYYGIAFFTLIFGFISGIVSITGEIMKQI